MTTSLLSAQRTLTRTQVDRANVDVRVEAASECQREITDYAQARGWTLRGGMAGARITRTYQRPSDTSPTVLVECDADDPRWTYVVVRALQDARIES